jgi:isopentenyl diphosphate isomerase/L-lactate dehydrogenase-like FMN-dependent dehydrogenase
MVFDFVDGGAGDEITLRANRSALDGLQLRPRMATAMVRPSLSTTVVGQSVRLPVLAAPCGFARVVHPDGEIGVARAAARAGTISILSSMANTPLEQVAEAAPDDAKPWFQLYALGGRKGADQLVERAAGAGYRALVITVDTPLAGNRERDLRNRVPQPLTVDLRTALRLGPAMVARPGWLAGFLRDGLPTRLRNVDSLTLDGRPMTQDEATAMMVTETLEWPDLARIRGRWPGPLLVKGILDAEDARRAVGIGADGVIVSNHGGRQLDSTPASVAVLPEVVEAVDGQADVLVDGGIQRGTDIIKALSLGARAVLVGRAYLWGLACQGERGVEAILGILRSELSRDLRLIGCPDVAALDRSWIRCP